MIRRALPLLGMLCCICAMSLLIVGCQTKTDNIDTSVPAANDDDAQDATDSTNDNLDTNSAADATSEADTNLLVAEVTDVSADSKESSEANTVKADAQERVVTGDWPMWGGSRQRNMVNATTGISLEFDPESGKNVLWTAKLGSHSYGNPVVGGGKVLVGTNNAAKYRPQHTGDRGCVLCFDEKTGKFLWQLTREKLPGGEENDWPQQGICSSSCIEGDRVWVVTNRCELMCLDLEGMYDGENDGPYTQEVNAEQQDADIVWVLDMMETLKVFPRNLATSSPVVYGDHVYAVTSNGVDKLGETIPAPEAPSFICVNKKTGEVVWKDNTPGKNILDGQWGSPAVGEVNGKAHVYFPGGDGWLYAFDAATGELIWKFDLNPKDSVYGRLGKGTRNLIIATPVFVDDSVLLASGRDPDAGEGVAYLYRMDATKSGDVSAELDANGDSVGEPNPNSAVIWKYGGVDVDGSINGEAESDIFKRSISTVAVHNGLVYAADLAGFLHCVDFQSGKRYWRADMLAAIWGSPMVADGKVFLGDEDGDLAIFTAGKELHEDQVVEKPFRGSLLCTATIANGVMYIAEPSRLYAIATQ